MINNKFSLIIAFYFAVFSPLQAEDENLAVSQISIELLENADAVVRYHRINYIFESTDNISETVEIAITAMDSKALDLLNIHLAYDPKTKIKNLNGTLYDAQGKRIRKLRDEQFYDVIAYDGFSLFQDNRIKYSNIQHGIFPLTVVYKYTISHKGKMGIPHWFPISDFNVAVEQSSLKIALNEGLSCRFMEKNLPKNSTISHSNQIHFWEVSALKAIEKEDFLPEFNLFLPNVRIGLNEFEFDKRKGNMATWKNFGLWNYELIKDRGELPQATIDKVRFTLLCSRKQGM
jgi:hypothetical protein